MPYTVKSPMVGKSELHIVRMSDPHLPEVFSLIHKENWGWEFAEIQQILSLDPSSSVVALDGKDIVGLVTCIDFGALAFIVHVIVKTGWRRKGLGARMMEKILAELDSRSVPVVELHANPEAVEFYNQFSFRKLEDISFYSNEAPHIDHGAGSDDGGLSWLSESDVPLMSEILSSATGYGRDDIDRALSKMPPDQSLARTGDERTTALLLSRTGLDLSGIGPWFMEGPEKVDAEAMMRTMLSALPAKRVDALAPGSNNVATAALESCGYSLAKAGIVRVARSSGRVDRFPQSVLAVGHLGLI